MSGVSIAVNVLTNVLVLHRVVYRERLAFEDITLERLEGLLELMDRDRTATIDQAFGNTSSGPKSGRTACLTFDDGNISDYELVLPRLLARGAVATFLVTTDWIGTKGFMEAAQIRALHDSGMQIGSHSATHSDFRSLSIRQRIGELLNSRMCLEDIVGAPVTTFAFPYGMYDRTAIETVFECGYEYSCISTHGVLADRQSVIPRNSIHGSMSRATLRRTVEARWPTRMHWRVEDGVKAIVKRVFPNAYYRLRSSIT